MHYLQCMHSVLSNLIVFQLLNSVLYNVKFEFKKQRFKNYLIQLLLYSICWPWCNAGERLLSGWCWWNWQRLQASLNPALSTQTLARCTGGHTRHHPSSGLVPNPWSTELFGSHSTRPLHMYTSHLHRECTAGWDARLRVLQIYPGGLCLIERDLEMSFVQAWDESRIPGRAPESGASSGATRSLTGQRRRLPRQLPDLRSMSETCFVKELSKNIYCGQKVTRQVVRSSRQDFRAFLSYFRSDPTYTDNNPSVRRLKHNTACVTHRRLRGVPYAPRFQILPSLWFMPLYPHNNNILVNAIRTRVPFTILWTSKP